MSPALDAVRLASLLAGCSFGSPLRALEATGSTNADALMWADQGVQEGALLVADHQTEGRGRKGRAWLSEPGRALLFSIVLRPQVEHVPLLSTAVGVGACEAIRALTHLSVLLKWPNDLVIDDRKLAGILVESRFSADAPPVAVVGMGINVSWDPAALPKEIADRATSIGTETARLGIGEAPSREAVLARVVSGIERRYRQLQGGDGVDIVTTAESLSSVVGREVVARLPGGEAVAGTVIGLADDGRLELETAFGYRVLSAGEVETVRRSGDDEKTHQMF
jgi:BirA family transcriptional regulator, biotin operon repressor / biotin---[acetyl-CoA-carboxylase] ligase